MACVSPSREWGVPYMGEDDLLNAVYTLVLQGPRRILHITRQTGSNQ